MNNPRCLYNSSFADFLGSDDNYIFGVLCDHFHGEALTTTREAWKAEISILKQVVAGLQENDGRIIFEYDIPRLGKRIDAVILLHGIVYVTCMILLEKASQIFTLHGNRPEKAKHQLGFCGILCVFW